MPFAKLLTLTLTESRAKLDQVVDGIIVAGVWILAFMLPELIYPPKGDVITASPIVGIPLALVFVVYIVRNFQKATGGTSTQKGDLLAKALGPLIIFSLMSWLILV